MAVLSPVVGVPADLLPVGISDVTQRSPIGLGPSLTIAAGGVALQRLFHKGERSLLVSGPGDVAFEYLALVIDRSQRDRDDWIDGIADAARADRTFPKDGDPEAVRAHLCKQQADGDAFQAIDDAESDWQNS